MAVKELEVETAFPLTSFATVNATTVQAASFGPYRVKVIVPVGLVPRVRCATSSFFFNDTATTEIYTLSLHDALPISTASAGSAQAVGPAALLFRSPE